MMHNSQPFEAPDYERSTDLGWTEDFHDLSVDDLRELPPHLQLGLDLAVLD